MTGLFADQVRDARASGAPLAVAAALGPHPDRPDRDGPPATPSRGGTRAATRRIGQRAGDRGSVAAAARRRGHRVGARDPVVRVVDRGSRVHGPGVRQSAGRPRTSRWAVVIIAFAGGMALFGWLVARRAQTLGVALGALAFLTIPALVLIVMTPALILFVIDTASRCRTRDCRSPHPNRNLRAVATFGAPAVSCPPTTSVRRGPSPAARGPHHESGGAHEGRRRQGDRARRAARRPGTRSARQAAGGRARDPRRDRRRCRRPRSPTAPTPTPARRSSRPTSCTSSRT